jgi:hypothetical protein
MDEFPARRRLLGQSDPPRNSPERKRGPETPKQSPLAATAA